MDAFTTMERLTPRQALQGDSQPMVPGTEWGKTWEYCWMRGAGSAA